MIIACPAPFASRSGNRVTALRWAGHLRSLGYRVRLGAAEGPATGDLLLALHATKSRGAQEDFHRRHPERPILLALTGTDLYLEVARGAAAATGPLERARLLIALHDEAGADLRSSWAAKTRVVPQSSRPIRPRRAPDPGSFEVVFLGHIRPVKDPHTLLRALALLPARSRLRATFAGAGLDPADTERFAAAVRGEPRATWVGPLRRRRALELLSGARALVSTSEAEGGANVLSEALVNDIPILATDIPGSRGILGSRHPGLFPVGDAAALATLFQRLEDDPAFAATLQAAGRVQAPRFSPERERHALAAALTEVGLPPPSSRIPILDRPDPS